MRRLGIAACMALLLTAFGTGGLRASHALADYGPGAQYQIEISYNCNSRTICTPVIGGTAGIWLWIELNADGTGDYHGADCLHGSGAISDSGNVTWSDSNGTLTINGLSLAGGLFQVPFTVPDTYGHYTKTLGQLAGLPFPGSAQVQVAP